MPKQMNYVKGFSVFLAILIVIAIIFTSCGKSEIAETETAETGSRAYQVYYDGNGNAIDTYVPFPHIDEK